MSAEKEPIACRTVAGALFHYADYLEGQSRQLQFWAELGEGELDAIVKRVKHSVEFTRDIAGRLHDQKGIIRDCAMLVILLEHAAVYVKAAHEDLPWHTVYNTRAELLRAIEEHTKSA